MIAYVQCIMSNDVLNLLLLHINDQNQKNEHVDATNEMDGPLM